MKKIISFIEEAICLYSFLIFVYFYLVKKFYIDKE